MTPKSIAWFSACITACIACCFLIAWNGNSWTSLLWLVVLWVNLMNAMKELKGNA